MPPAPGAAPSQAFTTCTTDVAEIAKLPTQTAELPDWLPAQRKQMQELAQRAQDWFSGALRPTDNNRVVPYIYGRCAFEDIADALASAYASEHRICLVGWWVEPWARLKNPLGGPPPVNPLLQDYLRSSQAQVRGLFWNALIKKKPGDNEAIANFINSLPHGVAIEDGKLVPGNLPTFGPSAHHQKLVVVKGALGLIAFLGGMDLNNTRVDVGGFNPLHDVHIRIAGPAAAECLAIFRDRWLDHPASAALDRAKFRMTPAAVRQDFDASIAAATRSAAIGSPETITASNGKAPERRLLVSIGKTYPKLSKFKPGDAYSFAPNGDQSAWQLVKNTIQKAKRFIYVEDQYFVSRRAKTELLTKIQEPEFQFLLILMGNSTHFEKDPDIRSPDNEFPYLIAARNEIRTDLASIDPERKKWSMFSLTPAGDPNRRQWCGDFVHSKLWIADDEFVAIGSANCDDRGYTFDTEIMAGITEEPLEHLAGSRFARDLRVALWHKHLGVPHGQVQDFAKGLRYWFKPPPHAMVVNASALEHSPLLGSGLIRDDKTIDYAWTHLIDPDADKI